MNENTFMKPNGIEKIIQSVAGVLSIIAGTALAAMMFLMATDVVCRYVLNSPIPGALELVEYMMAITIPLSIACCTASRSHVSVEMVVERLPRPVQTVISIIVSILMLVFITIVGWQSILNVVDSYKSNITSAVLHIPAYPFAVPVALGMSCYAVFMLLQLFIDNKRS